MLSLEDERELTRAEMWWLGEPSESDPEDEFEWQIADEKGEEEWAIKHMT